MLSLSPLTPHDPLDLLSARKFVMSFEVLRDWFAQCDDSIAPREVTREVFDAASRDGKIITRKFGNSKFICLIPPDPTWDDLHAITQTLHRHRFTPEKLTAET